MEGLDKKDKQVILEMFSHHSREIAEVEKTGITQSIRDAAKSDNEQLHKTWSKFEKLANNE